MKGKKRCSNNGATPVFRRPRELFRKQQDGKMTLLSGHLCVRVAITNAVVTTADELHKRSGDSPPQATPSLRPPDPWLQLLGKQLPTHVTLSPSDTVGVHSAEMLGELDDLLRDYSQSAPTLLDAIAWIIVQTYLWAMTGWPRTSFRNQSSSDRNVLAHGACHRLVNSRLGLLRAAPRVVKRYTRQVRKQLAEMFQALTIAAMELILYLRWVSDGAKEEAARKLGAMTLDVFPIIDFFRDEDRQALYEPFTPKDESSSFLVRFIEASAVLRGFVGTETYESVYRRRIGEGGAPLSLYEYYTNIVHVSLDALERPMFTLDGTHAMNYAGLGSYVAREVIRSFDPIGSAVDSTGAQLVWWGPSTSGEHRSRLSCL
ncbi:neprilysin-2-like [Rhipicephalus microplus]|uniref:neprilysin-2-like n=1 Tax=Rhipicephalus microplus TaxID=6941 RepID=UPI003F6D2DA5